MAIPHIESSWDIKDLEEIFIEIEKIAKEELKMDYYPNQIEVVTSEQLIDAMSYIGLPTGYTHWKYGKEFVKTWEKYVKGQKNLSYEMVINSNPCISYNMEENTYCLMVLVLAHACIGHNFFFKNNYMFKQGTDAESIIPFMEYSRNYIKSCEEKYGMKEVEDFLDTIHALEDYGVHLHKKQDYKNDKSKLEEYKRRINDDEKYYNPLWKTLPILESEDKKIEKKDVFPNIPEENILYFIEKFSPILKPWQREIIRIVYKKSQYFYPQILTKISNEGCLVEGSLIRTEDGLIDIKELVENKYSGKVWDGENWQKVYDWFIHENKRRLKIVTNKGIIHGGENHQILIDGVWVELSKLRIGTEINWTLDNSIFPMEKMVYKIKIIDIIEDYGTTYDFSVENTHRYYHNGVIHHNCATFTHHYILNRLYDKGFVSEGLMVEFIKHHSNVINQPNYSDKWYYGLNPYKLGFEIITDIIRIAKNENIDDEDKEWFGHLIGKDWVEVFQDMMINYNDESLIRQFLGPKVIRKLKLFEIQGEEDIPFYIVSDIHNKDGYKYIIDSLANSKTRTYYLPNIEIVKVDLKGNRVMYLKYTSYKNRKLSQESTEDVLWCLKKLWGFPIKLLDKNNENIVSFDGDEFVWGKIEEDNEIDFLY